MGVESMNSVISFDDALLGIGQNGINSCNGQGVQRIDYKIMDDVFDIYNANHATDRVCGIRDYYNDMVYWALPMKGDTQTPNKVLTYNPGLDTWAYNDESITAFGYYNKITNQDAWNIDYEQWQTDDTTWDSGEGTKGYRDIICGNSAGFMRIIDSNITRNTSSSYIALMENLVDVPLILAVGHGFATDDFVIIEYAQGTTNANDTIFQIYVVDEDSFLLNETVELVGTYTGGGTVAGVSRIDMLTKQYNFYEKQSKNMYLSLVDFHVDKTELGEITVDSAPNTTSLMLAQAGLENGANPGLYSYLETYPYPTVALEGIAEQLWHKVYFQAEGEYVQLRIFLNDDQMKNVNIAFSDFQLHGMILSVTPTFNI